MGTEVISEKIHALLTDENFLHLTSLQRKSNLFETLAASHLELWHSAFIKWLIDPSSDLGLGTFPLKRFLYTVIYKGKIEDEQSRSSLTLSDIEGASLELENMVFETEIGSDDNNSVRFDIYGINNSSHERKVLQIIIENKVKAKETRDQTERYFQSVSETNDYEHTLLIFLSPSEHGPKCKRFYHISYQNICDYVIKACLRHPDLKDESKFLLEHYQSNLNKGKKPMANPNKELCAKIYEAHEEILNEIFLAVKEEKPREKKNIKEKIISAKITLTDLEEKGYININDKLLGRYNEKIYYAELVKNDHNRVLIKYNGA